LYTILLLTGFGVWASANMEDKAKSGQGVREGPIEVLLADNLYGRPLAVTLTYD